MLLVWAADSGRAETTSAATTPVSLACRTWKPAITPGRSRARPFWASRPRNFLVVALNFALSAMADRPLAWSSAEMTGD
ncbi:hypothetical protein D3C71_1858220 [compost metagenome]